MLCRKLLDNGGYFNPLTPGGVRPVAGHRGSNPISDFNPLTPGGVRLEQMALTSNVSDFNPLTPGGVRHKAIRALNNISVFQSTHPEWGETLDLPV